MRSATVGETPAKEPALSVVLGGSGAPTSTASPRRHQGSGWPSWPTAKLVSAPVLNYASFAGRVQVTGLSKEKTDDLFRRLNKIIKTGLTVRPSYFLAALQGGGGPSTERCGPHSPTLPVATRLQAPPSAKYRPGSGASPGMRPPGMKLPLKRRKRHEPAAGAAGLHPETSPS